MPSFTSFAWVHFKKKEKSRRLSAALSFQWSMFKCCLDFSADCFDLLLKGRHVIHSVWFLSLIMIFIVPSPCLSFIGFFDWCRAIAAWFSLVNFQWDVPGLQDGNTFSPFCLLCNCIYSSMPKLPKYCNLLFGIQINRGPNKFPNYWICLSLLSIFLKLFL